MLSLLGRLSFLVGTSQTVTYARQGSYRQSVSRCTPLTFRTSFSARWALFCYLSWTNPPQLQLGLNTSALNTHHEVPGRFKNEKLNKITDCQNQTVEKF